MFLIINVSKLDTNERLEILFLCYLLIIILYVYNSLTNKILYLRIKNNSGFDLIKLCIIFSSQKFVKYIINWFYTQV